MTTPIHTDAAYIWRKGLEFQAYLDAGNYVEPGTPERQLSDGNLYVLASGLGRRTQQSEAARKAVDVILSAYYQSVIADPKIRLQKAFEQAGAAVNALGDEEEGGRVATTAVAALIRGDSLLVAHIGDCRAYLCRDSRIRQLTKDHTMAQRLVDAGGLSPDEARTSSTKRVMDRGLGLSSEVKVDTMRVAGLQPGDVILLTTQGLHRHFEPATTFVPYIQKGETAEAIATMLMRTASDQDGSESVSVMVIRLTEPEEPMPAATTQPAMAAAAVPPAGWMQPGAEPELPEPDDLTVARPRIHRAVGPPPATPAPGEADDEPGGGGLLRWLVIGGVALMLLLLVGGLAAAFAFDLGPFAAAVPTETVAPTEAAALPTATLAPPTPTIAPAATEAPAETATAEVTPTEETPAAEEGICTWEVEEGNVISIIGLRSLGYPVQGTLTDEQSADYDLLQAEIVQLNGLESAGSIFVGQVLLIPWRQGIPAGTPATVDVNGVLYPDCRTLLPTQ